ncbi:hypothetical protein CW712_04220 [Candidatus Bathyarchaeota archaeon]|nr:MAG: hypothetical protein CW712_04220 [Candidatus Bathyarchaeota archaeon]
MVILNILENFDIGSLGAFKAEKVHLFVEAAKRAYVKKNQYLAGPTFTEIPLDKILSKTHAQNLAESIEPESVFVDASSLTLRNNWFQQRSTESLTCQPS